jgi:hypothetical protein
MDFSDVGGIFGGALILAAIYGLVRLALRLIGAGEIFPQV